VTQYHLPPGYQPYAGAHVHPAPQRRNGMGTTGLVLGIIALALSWIPIVGVLCFVFGVFGLIFGSIGISRAARGLADNKSAAVAGVVTSGLAIVVRLAIYTAIAVSTQFSAGAVTPSPSGARVPAAPPPPQSQSQSRPQPESTVFRAGETAETGGFVVTVNALQPQRSSPAEGSRPLLCSLVTLSNSSGEEKPFIGRADWKLDDPRRVLHAPSQFGDNLLDFGMLPPGDEVTGNICFEDPGHSGTYVIIYDNHRPDLTTASWTSSR
jgi:hypothetical protein